MTRPFGVSASILLLLAVVTGCAQPGTSGGSVATGTQRIASSVEWSKEGARLIAGKEKAASRVPDMGNKGAWAYQSRPIDILGDGEYALEFEVPAGFNASVSDETPVVGFAFDFPGDTDFQIMQSGPFIVRQLDDKHAMLRIDFRVQDVRAPYPNYSVWIS